MTIGAILDGGSFFFKGNKRSASVHKRACNLGIDCRDEVEMEDCFHVFLMLCAMSSV